MRAGDGHRGVWLDTPRLDRREPGLLEKQLPNLMSRARIAGLDPRTHPLLVHPTLHCQNGGIAIGVNGESSVPGLFAVGDVELCPGSGHYIGGEETAALEWMEGTSPFRKRRNALASSSTPP